MAQDDRPWDEVAADLVANGVDADVAAEMAVDAAMAAAAAEERKAPKRRCPPNCDYGCCDWCERHR